MSEALNRPGVDVSLVPVLEVGSLEELEALHGLPSQSVGNLWEGSKWGENLGEGVVLTTSFSVEGVSVFTYADGFELPGLMAFNDTQVEAAWWAMNAWSAVSQVTFVEVQDTGEAAGDIRWSQTSSPNVWTALAYYPSDLPEGGDVWFGVGDPEFTDPYLGGYGWFTYLHELGHALGLGHPHQGWVDPLPWEDQLKYSVMSYSDTDWLPWWQSGGYVSTSFPITPMLNDIAAMQWLYGANMGHATGDDVYRWEADAVVFETIWDAGGEDTLDASNQAQGVELNLNAGRWSWIGVGYGVEDVWVRDTLTIAYGAVIEHAVGSAFDDTLVGNEVGNRLDGGAGVDTVDYFSAPAGVHVDLSQGLAWNDGHGSQDTLVSIEAVRGSYYDDTLVGDAGDNRLDGGEGGHDWIDGGSGFDTVDYFSSYGVHVDLSQGLALEFMDGAQDTLVSIEAVWGSEWNDVLMGDEGDNLLDGKFADDLLIGGGGDDTLFGDNGADSLYGGDGHDRLYAGKGDDTLQGGAGHDLIDGGDDRDTVYYDDAAAGVVLRLWANRAEQDGHGGRDTLVSIENVVGSSHDDWLAGNADDNWLRGLSGDDTLRGGAGTDTLIGDAGDDRLDGGLGVDVAYYAEAGAGVVVKLWKGVAEIDGDGGSDTLVSIENVVGSGFDDFIAGDHRDNFLNGWLGDDTLRGGSGDDTLEGGAGHDLLHGGEGHDMADYSTAASGVVVKLWKGVAENDGEGGQDRLVAIEDVWGSSFDDFIAGDWHNNWLNGGAGNDTLRGGSGDDTLMGGAGNDLLHGGDGYDMADYGWASSGVVVRLWQGLAENDGDGGNDILVSIEDVQGSAFDDLLIGDRHGNWLFGGGGHDVLRGRGDDDVLDGGEGDDTLEGGDGNDVLIGGAGHNVLDGGAGDDTLYLNDGINWVAVWTGGGQDTVHGFSAAKGDVLALGFDLNGSGITTTEQALAAAQQMGSDVVVDVGAGQQVTLVGVQLADLGIDAFVVV